MDCRRNQKKHLIGNRSGLKVSELKTEFVKRTEALLDEFDRSNYSTIDDYAYSKYSGGTNINYIRAILSAYISLRQIIIPVNSRFQRVDSRYRVFLQKLIIKGNFSKAQNLNLLTWNYDNQLEMSLREIYPNDWSSILHEKLNLFPSIDQYGMETDRFEIKKLNTYYLNGSSGFHQNRESQKLSVVKDYVINPNAGVDSISQILYFFYLYHQDIMVSPMLHFGWEDNDYNRKVLKMACASVSETQKLYLVGYTFPDPNRNIDLKLINAMNKLKTIYIQGPSEKKFKEIKFKLTESFPVNDIKYYESKDDFLIPNELLAG